eukprot:g64688.t1
MAMVTEAMREVRRPGHGQHGQSLASHAGSEKAMSWSACWVRLKESRNFRKSEEFSYPVRLKVTYYVSECLGPAMPGPTATLSTGN